MTSRIIVSVTQRDIDVAESMPRVPSLLPILCPVARALRRHRPFRRAMVTSFGRVLGSDYNILAPVRVRKFVRAFDQGRPVEPFAFEIEVPA